jgi:lambda repressor-like predicted transcriptional regulator
VALSTADSNKWLLLVEDRLERQTPEDHTSSDYQLLGPISQRQRRLTEAQVIQMAARYEEGATVYELAAEFDCHRTTVAARLKKAGIAMRSQSPTSEDIDTMMHLYAAGHSLLEVGKQLGYSANTVRSCLQEQRIHARDTHGRDR